MAAQLSLVSRPRWRINRGDVVEVLRSEPDNSFDGVLCDPPYGLSFMGKRWDYDVPSVELWREVLRVLKPGSPLLAFGGTRTYHRTVVAIEDAGFEIRDQLAWMYGSGFPKSLDVSKAIDARPGIHLREQFGRELAAARDAAGMSRQDVSERVVGTRTGACWNWEHHQFPEARHWPALKAALPTLHDAWGEVLAQADREKTGKVTATRLAVAPGQDNDRRATTLDITAPSTSLAQEWQGYGTALKPAHEPIVLARKPLDGTVAQNVAQWGVGGLSIDACRIDKAEGDTNGWDSWDDPGSANTASGGNTARTAEQKAKRAHPPGRWPANVILDEEAGAILDAQSGDRPGMSGGGKHRADYPGGMFGGIDSTHTARGDNGGASRFFYCAKVSTRERAGSKHPTMKPLALTEYLARLIMPPRPGLLLVPFAGSGSEMIGALRAGWAGVVGIEREAEYVETARRRLETVT